MRYKFKFQLNIRNFHEMGKRTFKEFKDKKKVKEFYSGFIMGKKKFQ